MHRWAFDGSGPHLLPVCSRVPPWSPRWDGAIPAESFLKLSSGPRTGRDVQIRPPPVTSARGLGDWGLGDWGVTLLQEKAVILLISHTTGGFRSEVWNLFFPLKVTNQIRGPSVLKVPLESTLGGDRVLRSEEDKEKSWFCVSWFLFYIRPRGNCAAVTAGTGYKKGVCVPKREKTVRRVLFSCHCL